MNITYRSINEDELHDEFLKDFERYQEVKNDWAKVNGEFVLKFNAHIENWSEEKKIQKVNKTFKDILESEGILFGAFENEKLIGFAGCGGLKFGSKKQYIQLTELHVSYKHRGWGIGRKLFEYCIEYAEELSVENLYIVASSSEESQIAYKKLGCVYATEIQPTLFEQDPDDIHMEFSLINR